MRPGPILVTGATGFVGRHLVRRLAADERDVHALVRAHGSRRPALPPGAEVHEVADATAQVADLVDALRPTTVVHLATAFAARHEPSMIAGMIEANVTFGTVVAEAATRVGARLVHATSAWQHYEGGDYAPVSLYAATKQALVDVLAYYQQVAGLEAAEVCLFDTYGPDDDRRKLVWLLLEHARTGADLPMSSGLQLVDLTHVDDVVEAFLRQVDSPRPAARLVARTGTPRTVREIAATVEQVTGRTLAVRWGERPERDREMRTDWAVPGESNGWAPRVGLADGLRRLWELEGSDG